MYENRIVLKDILSTDHLKCIICDLDDTLFAWMDVMYKDILIGDHDTSVEAGMDPYAREHGMCIPIPHMQEFIRLIRPIAESAYVLTCEIRPGWQTVKENAVSREYAGMFDGVILTPVRSKKLSFLEKLCIDHGYRNDQILVIDDSPMTRDDIMNHGYMSTTPSAVAVYMHERAMTRNYAQPKTHT